MTPPVIDLVILLVGVFFVALLAGILWRLAFDPPKPRQRSGLVYNRREHRIEVQRAKEIGK